MIHCGHSFIWNFSHSWPFFELFSYFIFNPFSRMLCYGLQTNAHTFLFLFKSCLLCKSKIYQGKQLHAHVLKLSIQFHPHVHTSVIHMYVSVGELDFARLMFDKSSLRYVVSFTALIIGCIFRTVMLMILDGFLIDLLARAGKFEEAEILLMKDMEMESDGAIWVSLLSACKAYGRVEFGEYVADRLFRLEPENAGAFVLLSNIYAGAGRLDDVARIRTRLNDKGKKKVPGCTSIEIDVVVHEFLVGDKFHLECKSICRMLDEVDKLLEENGFVPDTSEVLYDMDEESKEGALSQHSEKLHPWLIQHIPTCFATNSDAIEVRPQFPMINDRSEQHSFKRARMIGNNHSNALPCPPPRMMQPPPQSNKGTGHIFYKTRTYTRFTFGNCRNGDNCNFPHVEEELRQPPPNWQDLVGPCNERKEERVQVGNWYDDKKIIHKMKLCKKFYNGEQCPYGEKCSFLHEDPAKLRADSWKSRECSAISIGTIGSPKPFGDGSDNLEGNSGVTKQPKGTYWKTKLCAKWQNTGSCPFGDDCHFAHGEADLQAPGGGIEAEAEAAVAIANSTKATVPASPNALSVSASVQPAALQASLPVATEDEKTKKNILIWSRLNKRKINNIYADCPEDIAPLPNFPRAIESWPEKTVHWYNFLVRDMCICQFLWGVSMDLINFCGILGWINIVRISPDESALLHTGPLLTTQDRCKQELIELILLL